MKKISENSDWYKTLAWLAGISFILMGLGFGGILATVPQTPSDFPLEGRLIFIATGAAIICSLIWFGKKKDTPV